MREGFAVICNLNTVQHCSSSWPSFVYFVRACGARVVILEHGALDICMSSVCTENRKPLWPFHSHCVQFFLVSGRSETKRLVCDTSTCERPKGILVSYLLSHEAYKNMSFDEILDLTAD